MGYEGIVGGAIGGTAGAIGGMIEARQRQHDIRKLRRNISTGVNIGTAEAARSVGNIMSSREYLTGANFIRSFFGLGDTTNEIAGKVQGEFGENYLYPSFKGSAQLGGASGGRVIADNLALGAGQFMGKDSQGNPLDALSTDFVKSLRAAQAARGLDYSQAAGAAEAAGLAGFRAQMQAQLVPQLMALAEGPASYRQKYESGYLNRNVFQQTQGAAVYGQANPDLAFTPNIFAEGFKGLAAGYAAGSAAGGGGGGGGLLSGLL
jgi:hypothetical protein